MKNERRTKKKNTILILIQVLLIIIMLYSGYQIFTYYYENYRSSKQLKEANSLVEDIESEFNSKILNETINKKVKETVTEANDNDNNGENTEEVKLSKEELDEKAKLVVQKLKEKNSDVVGYVKFDEAKIKFPILYKEGSNQYYLWKDLNKNPSRPGSIFLNGYNNSDFLDMNTTLFGHNLKTNPDQFAPMFKLLLQFEHSENVDQNKEYFVEIYTENGYKKYKVFTAYYSTSNDDYILSSRDEKNWVKYLNERKEMSINKFSEPEAFVSEDKLLTLSTCDDGDGEFGDAGRFVVQAIEVE